jgi:hypothetical protein
MRQRRGLEPQRGGVAGEVAMVGRGWALLSEWRQGIVARIS